MRLRQLFIALGLIVFAAISLAQAQSTCAPEQRKEFALTAVDKDGTAKDRAKLELEVVDPEMRKAKPVLAYKRY